MTIGPISAAAAVLALSAATAAPAQNTWIVDAQGGAGSHFRTIHKALNAAADGDTILVRAGTYTVGSLTAPLTTSKGVQLVGDPGVTFAALPFPRFAVDGLPAGRTFTMRGFTFDPIGILSLTDNAGLVHLEDLHLSPTTLGAASLYIDDSAQVSATGVTVTGYNNVQVVGGSHVVFTNCAIHGLPMVLSAPALQVSGSRVAIVGGTVRGGPSSPLAPASPAIVSFASRLTLAGSGTTIAAGSSSRADPIPAVRATGGSVDWDPAVTLTARGGAAPITGSAVVTQRRIPSVVADGLANGGTWQIDLHAPPGSAFCLFASLPVPALATPFGELWFDPRNPITLVCGSVPAGEVFQHAIPLPAQGVPRGVPLVVQGGVAHSQTIEASQPAVSIVE